MSALRVELRSAADVLRAAGVPSADFDASALAAHVLGVRIGDLARVERLEDTDRADFAALVERRAQRVPLQHLTGSVGFRHLQLDVGPGVFVPRPETEHVVQWALDAVRSQGWDCPLLVDLCTGSGAIALALVDELPRAHVHAVERDASALAWAQRNLDRLAIEGDSRVHLHHGDARTALPELNGTVDLVISNPPYVATTESWVPEPEVLKHDPAAALWGGLDGLDVIREVEIAARRLLRPGGLVVVEHSDRQGKEAPAVFEAAGGWADVADHQDLTGRDRFLTARWAE
ncbi:MAG TPA: peptide chain release factor N(5)-glutamine methyltransferase [Mycobacteriales bacterium]|nr:peptide chain release factor N(5)-glutamine methyltransferase [Mycobacteriales bacterium]